MSDCCGQPSPPCLPPTVTTESVASQIQNLIQTLLGTFTVTVVNGRGTWAAPCNITANSGLPGYPIMANEGYVCYLLRIIGTIVAQPPAFLTRVVTSSTTALPTDEVLICQPTAIMTLTIPAGAALPPGRFFTIQTNGAYAVTIAMTGSDTLDGVASKTLAVAGESITIVQNVGTGTWIIT